MHQTISRTRAALPSVISGPLSDFHSLIKSNIWYLRSESARDPKPTPQAASPVPFSVCDKLMTASTKISVFRQRCLTMIDRSEMIRAAPSAPHELGEAHAEPWSGGGTS